MGWLKVGGPLRLGVVSSLVVVCLLVPSSASARVPAAWLPHHVAPRAGAGSALVLDSFATVNPTVPPSIGSSPPAQVDEVLTANPGTWPGSGWMFSYLWLDCDPSNASSCVTIPGATASTYTVAPADGGSTLEVQVNADDHVGDAGSATSAPTATVVARAGAPVVVTDPSVQTSLGGGVVGATGSAGSWSNNPTSFTYQWLSCTPSLTSCLPVGSDQPTYAPVSSDNGNVLVLVVVATNAVGDSVPATSQPSATIAMPPTVTISSPSAQSYALGAQITASYTCTAPPGSVVGFCQPYLDYGPPFCGQPPTMVPCNGYVPDGGALPSMTPGFFHFTVVAVDTDGAASNGGANWSVGSTLPTPPARPTVQILALPPPRPVVSAPALAVTDLAQSNARWRRKAAARSTERVPLGTPLAF